MISKIIQILKNLGRVERKNIWNLQFLILFVTFFELLTIVLIGPFFKILSDKNIIFKNYYLEFLFNNLNFRSEENFILSISLFLLIIITFTSILNIYAIYKISINSNLIGSSISSKLYKFFIKKDWIYHTENNSSVISNKLIYETERLCRGIIEPFLFLIARSILCLSIFFVMFYYNFTITFIVCIVLLFSYFIIYFFLKKILQLNSKIVSDSQVKMLTAIQEGFGGLKEALILLKQFFFFSKFKEAAFEKARAIGINGAINYFPRYFIEFLSISSIILITIYLIISRGTGIIDIFATLATYGFAGFKLLPAMQQIFSSFATIKGNISALHSLESDILNSKNISLEENINLENLEKLQLKKNIKFENINFKYPSNTQNLFEGLNLEFTAYKTIGLVGPSGSGKTTVLDILCGLLKPTQGEVVVDNININLNQEYTQKWRKNLGYVSQNMFLTDNSIKNNIAFGVKEEEIDLEKVRKALSIAELDLFVNSLPLGINTLVGERGIQLSGGQRQRIGIARAVYNEAEVLLFDEATSSLDGIIEKNIMKSINDLKGKKTIVIIAHRLTTIKSCDVIYFFEKGRVIDKGNYSYLFDNYEKFRIMAGENK